MGLSSQSRSVEEKAFNSPPWSHHLPDEAFLADPFNGFELTVIIKLLDLAKLTGDDVNRVVGFNDSRLEYLGLEGSQGIGFQGTHLHCVERMVLWQERALDCPQCLAAVIIHGLPERGLRRAKPNFAQGLVVVLLEAEARGKMFLGR
jgi:hypothetical protein